MVQQKTSEEAFLARMAKEGRVRVAVRSLCFQNQHVLVQRPTDDEHACFAFLGGRLELGETMAERLRKEYEEETNARVTRLEYLFVVENRFEVPDGVFHAVEHFFLVEIDRHDIKSREPLLSQHWLPVAKLGEVDLRPHVVRDLIVEGAWERETHLIVPFSRTGSSGQSKR